MEGNLLQYLLVLAVIATAIGVLFYPFGASPFWWAKAIKRYTKSSCQGLSKMFSRGAKKLWKTPFSAAAMIAWPVALATYILSIFFSSLVHFLGGKKGR
ncbi:MAG: hypothetical protein HYR90_00100 [Candidatus Andersenbacteria bacterium]|nr:hypothetical protein [Candidatus Andersenbacteria bacterium]MBI3251130.1 hypothetical protein [Candidatus Andersenbacteria bacterium]